MRKKRAAADWPDRSLLLTLVISGGVKSWGKSLRKMGGGNGSKKDVKKSPAEIL